MLLGLLLLLLLLTTIIVITSISSLISTTTAATPAAAAATTTIAAATAQQNDFLQGATATTATADAFMHTVSRHLVDLFWTEALCAPGLERLHRQLW